jgi:hypothetical protein
LDLFNRLDTQEEVIPKQAQTFSQGSLIGYLAVVLVEKRHQENERLLLLNKHHLMKAVLIDKNKKVVHMMMR